MSEIDDLADMIEAPPKTTRSIRNLRGRLKGWAKVHDNSRAASMAGSGRRKPAPITLAKVSLPE